MPGPGDLLVVTIAPAQSKIGPAKEIKGRIHRVDVLIKDGLYKFVCGAQGAGHTPGEADLQVRENCGRCKIPPKGS